jgi:hypothetical protein
MPVKNAHHFFHLNLSTTTNWLNKLSAIRKPPTSLRNLQISPLCLLALNRLEKTLKVTCAKAFEIVPLDDLKEHSRLIREGLSEGLQQIATLIKVHEDAQLLDPLQIFIDMQFLGPSQALTQRVVVVVRHGDELHAALLQIQDCGADVVGKEGDVLHAIAAVEGHELFDLRLLEAGRGLVDGDLDEAAG